MKTKAYTADNRLHVGADRIAKGVHAALLCPHQYLTDTPPIPRNMQLEPTNICNYHCAFCASPKLKKRPLR